jgi:thiamine transport system substrate-binding protein
LRVLNISAPLLVALSLAACGSDQPRELVVLTHDSFDATESLIAEFEEERKATVTFVSGGDANAIVNRAILNAGNPEADVLYGVDNLTFRRALEAGVFTDFEAERRDEIAADLLEQLDDSPAVTPIDYGFVALNFDLAAGEPPASLEALTEEEWRGRLVVEDPATSSPGLQFLATTVAHFSEEGDYTWREFWADLRANDVLITDGWSDAYYTQFSLYDGDRPVVVSYTTSPAAEVFFNELEEPPTVAVLTGPLFRQVEAAAILDGANEEDLAGDFIDFMLSEEFQRQIPETMFVYPALSTGDEPEWWRWAEVGATVAELDASQEDIDRWVSEWTEIMRR